MKSPPSVARRSKSLLLKSHYKVDANNGPKTCLMCQDSASGLVRKTPQDGSQKKMNFLPSTGRQKEEGACCEVRESARKQAGQKGASAVPQAGGGGSKHRA